MRLGSSPVSDVPLRTIAGHSSVSQTCRAGRARPARPLRRGRPSCRVGSPARERHQSAQRGGDDDPAGTPGRLTPSRRCHSSAGVSHDGPQGCADDTGVEARHSAAPGAARAPPVPGSPTYTECATRLTCLARSAVSEMSARCTRWPAAARRRVRACPLPPAAPVTTAVPMADLVERPGLGSVPRLVAVSLTPGGGEVTGPVAVVRVNVPSGRPGLFFDQQCCGHLVHVLRW